MRNKPGRKTKSPTGDKLKTRCMRWTDTGWSEVRFIGVDRVRELVAQEAAKIRSKA